MEFVKNWIIPLIKLSFYLGIFSFFSYMVAKAFNNAWGKKYKFVWKYKIRKKPYPEKTMSWIMEIVDKKYNWYRAKKILMVANIPQKKINETLWIYDQILIELNQNGGKKNGRKHQGSYREIKKQQELPKV